MPIRFSQCEPMRDSRSALLCFPDTSEAGRAEYSASPDGPALALPPMKVAARNLRRRRFGRDSRRQVQCALNAKHPGGKFAYQPPQFLQFVARSIHLTSGKLISVALSAKLVWLSRTIKGTNHEVSH